MKKKLAVLLVFCMIMSLCACTNTEKEEKDAEMTESAETEESEEPEESVAEKIGFDVEEQTLIDADGIKIVAKGVSMIEVNGNYTVGLTVTNSTDKKLNVGFRDSNPVMPTGEHPYSYVNGYQIGISAYIDVNAGETVEDDMIIPADFLELLGISNVGELELAFSVMDENYDEILQEENAKCVLKTTAADEMDTELSEDMIKVLDEKGWQAYAKYLPADNYSSHGCILAVVRNNTKESEAYELKTIMADDTVLEYELEGTDIKVDSGDYCYGNPGRATVSYINLDKYNNVPSVEDMNTIKFSLEIGGLENGNRENMFTLETESFPIK